MIDLHQKDLGKGIIVLIDHVATVMYVKLGSLIWAYLIFFFYQFTEPFQEFKLLQYGIL